MHMEAYGSVLIDQAVYAKRNNPSVPVFSGSCNHNSISNGFLRRSASQQLLSCHGAVFPGTRPPLYPSSPLPAPTYRSLPPPHLLQQPCPPLLPLPLSRSFSLPFPSPPVSARRVTGGATARSANKDQKKPRPSLDRASQPGRRPYKEPPAAASSPPGRVPKSAAATINDGAAKKEGGDFTGDVYALSPPPSSLPMPSFSLRARAAPSFSPSPPRDAEALGGEFESEASDDLRHLLRL